MWAENFLNIICDFLLTVGGTFYVYFILDSKKLSNLSKN